MLVVIILIAIGIYFLWPLIKVGMTVNRARNSVRDAFRQAQAENEARRRAQQNARQQQRPRRRKIITRDVGEYVDFEEIATHQTSDDSASTYTKITYTEEQQVEDAEWEDIV